MKRAAVAALLVGAHGLVVGHLGDAQRSAVAVPVAVVGVVKLVMSS